MAQQLWGARVRELLGIEIAVLQGGMACVSTAELAAAVSNAGGLGIIGAGRMTIETLVSQIAECSALTDKPFAVNFMAIAPKDDPTRVTDIIDAIVSTGQVTTVTIGAGALRPAQIETLKSAGIKVLPVVPNARWARAWVDKGADAVIPEGRESGGHIGEGFLADICQDVVDAVGAEVPVIFAGGIYDSLTAADAVRNGADGVQVGTAFMVAEETEIAAAVKQMIVAATGDCTTTTVTPKSIGAKEVRVMWNPLAEQFHTLHGIGDEAGKEHLGAGALERAMKEGDIEMGSVMCGMCAAHINAIEPAAAILDRISGGVDALVAT